MAALTGPRNTEKLGGGDICPLPSYPVLASTTIYAGALVGLTTAGYLVPMSGANQRVVGVANETVDNSSGANGDKTCGVDTGVFRMVNDGTNTVTLANVGAGATIYAEDDQTVGNVAGSLSVAGVAVGLVGGAGSDVWVKVTL